MLFDDNEKDEFQQKTLEAMYEDEIAKLINLDSIHKDHRQTILSKLTRSNHTNLRINFAATPKGGDEMMSQIDRQQGEKEFFKLIVLSEMVNTPDFISQVLLLEIDPVEMYERAKYTDNI